nr:hypothetical protein CFP56_02523 [Quercus suber]
MSLARNTFQRDQIRFLYKTNSEAKVRRSTVSLVSGKARVVSYEDPVEARAERTKKELAEKDGKKGKSQAEAQQRCGRGKHATAKWSNNAQRQIARFAES